MESARVLHVRLAFCSICYTELAWLFAAAIHASGVAVIHRLSFDTALPRMQLNYHIIKYPTMNVSADVYINNNIIQGSGKASYWIV